MTKSSLIDLIQSVADEFTALKKNLHPIGLRLLSDSDFFLTELLTHVASYGTEFPKTGLKKTAIALEFLDQATNLGGFAQSSASFFDESLLATDYFYAEAINQVINLDNPKIIKILAKAISDTAATRTCVSEPTRRKHLVEAAVELGLLLGGSNHEKVDTVRSLVPAYKAGEDIIFLDQIKRSLSQVVEV